MNWTKTLGRFKLYVMLVRGKSQELENDDSVFKKEGRTLMLYQTKSHTSQMMLQKTE